MCLTYSMVAKMPERRRASPILASPPIDSIPRYSALGRPWFLALGNGRTYQIAPLRPRSVVVAHARIAQELRQHKPGVRRPLPDPAVSDHLVVRADPLAPIQRPQLPRRFQGAILRVGRARPRGALRDRDAPP